MAWPGVEAERPPAAIAPGRQTRRWFVRHYVFPYWRLLLPTMLCMILSSAAAVMMVHALEGVLDDLLADGLRGGGARVLAYFFAAGVAAAVTQAGYSLLLPYLLQRLATDLKDRLFRHIVRLDYGFFANENPGRILSYLVNDAEQIQQMFRAGVLGLARNFTLALFLACFMIWKDWLLSLAVLSVFPFLLVLTRRLGRRVRLYARRAQEERAALLRHLEEAVGSIRNIKASSTEAGESAQVERKLRDLRHTMFRMDKVNALGVPFLEILALAGMTGGFAYGAWRTEQGLATAGEVTAFFIAMLATTQPLRQLSRSFLSMQAGLAALQRVYGLMLVSPTVRESLDARPLPASGRGGASVSFEGVSFSYSGDDRFALYDVSFRIPSGSTAAFVGPSGAGKSTLFNLLLRFWDPGAGRVRLNGRDVRDLTFASLRGAIAPVSQDIDFFDDTIRNNLLYGLRAEPDEAEIRGAAERADAHGFISELPQGYETRIGARGIRLSGGQRQRLALTRAFLRDAELLLLDEATSALDAESEAWVHRMLRAEGAARERTILIIAHRLSTVRHAERIFLLDRGRIVESGSHAELLAAGGRYARLVRLQTQFRGAGLLRAGEREAESRAGPDAEGRGGAERGASGS